MGHYEPEWEDYNPVTDRYRYGPKKYVEDETDRREKYESFLRETETHDISYYINSIRESSDYDAIDKAREAIKESRALSADKKLYWTRELNAHLNSLERIEAVRREATYQQNKENAEKKRKEKEERKQAKEAAKKRYKSLSLFGKIKYFRKRPSTIDIYQQSSEEINNLYRKRK